MFGAAELIIDKEAYEMNTVWKYVKPLEEEEAIKTFLAEKNINLPGTLITLLERYNGGRPSDKDFETKSGREYVFKSLLSYNRGDRETMMYMMRFSQIKLCSQLALMLPETLFAITQSLEDMNCIIMKQTAQRK